MQRLGLWSLIGFLGIVGTVLFAGGAVLIGEGGSFYYLAAGALTLASAALLARCSALAFTAYGLLLLITLVWSLWEVGLDGWALAPRLLGPGAVGLLFLLPAVARHAGAAPRWSVAVPALASLGAVALAGVLAAMPGPGSSAPDTAAADTGPTEWQAWGNAPGGGRHVKASQINPGNVGELKQAWRFDAGLPLPAYANFEATPLFVEGRLYVCLSAGVVAALDPDSGRQLWRYLSPGLDKLDLNRVFGAKCRGVSYYRSAQAQGECAGRILFTSPDGYLRAVDSQTGKPCTNFGLNGATDLHAGMTAQLPASRQIVAATPVSPPAVVNGVAVLGQTVSDLASLDAPSGVIRGYDAETGKLLWAWNSEMPAPSPEEGKGDAYARATPNAWGVLSGDEALGLVYVPLGNSPPDYYGGSRPKELDRFTTSVVALDVATGKLRWSFQTVHHDLWDYDLAAQPVAVDLPGKGGVAPALLVPTKLGQIFVLDRRTGQPIDPVVERKVPQGGVPGERTSPTQPYTTGFPSLSGPDLTERDMWGVTPLDQMWCRIKFKRLRYEGQYTPVGLTDTLMYPGTAGGVNWGSVSIDPARGLMVVNALRFGNLGRLIPREKAAGKQAGGKEGAVIFEQAGVPYVFEQSTFMSPLGVPCQRPPYGTISAFDLKTRQPVWSNSFGTAAKAGPFNIPSGLPIRMGVPNMGGSVVTSAGLTFIGAAQDRRIRAYETTTGRELWSAGLPAVAAATPMSFVSPRTGRQYVVIASGGHYALPGPQAGALIAFALPPEKEKP